DHGKVRGREEIVGEGKRRGHTVPGVTGAVRGAADGHRIRLTCDGRRRKTDQNQRETRPETAVAVVSRMTRFEVATPFPSPNRRVRFDVLERAFPGSKPEPLSLGII